MLTLDQLIAEATALPDIDKTILLEKILDSITGKIDQDILQKGLQKAKERLNEIENGTVETIPGDIALAQVRKLLES
jgi:hypothetical protein